MNHQTRSLLRQLAAFVAGAALLLLSGASLADPPLRVARLSAFAGAVSFSPAGEDEWAAATLNRPLITGDRLWTEDGARAELEAGSAALRFGPATSANMLNLDDNATQVEVTQGSVYVRAWRVNRGSILEIDTPNLAFTISRPGRYRIDVDPQTDATSVEVIAGEGEAYGEGAAYVIGSGDRYSFAGTGLRDYEFSDILPPDEFEHWADERDRRYETSASARYVSREVIGYQDLDDYGSWSTVASYGSVWYPRSVPSGWAPYRDGHWSWIEPWGWTWVDDEPWGFAPFHYGRWAYVGSRWGWIPGPIAVRPVYAPALVAFVGGGDLRLSLSVGGAAPGIAWFPLGPGEVYRPSYRVSRNYFSEVNVSNTRITNVNITNVYNNYVNNVNVTNVTYRNRAAPGAVTAVPTTAFVQSQPVARHAVRVAPQELSRQPVTAVAQVAPTRASLVAATAATGNAARPPQRALGRNVVARNKPPPAPAPFAARQAGLAARPGQPAEAATATGRGTGAAQPAGEPRQNIKVVAPTRAAAAPPKDESRRARNRAGEPADRGAAVKGPQAPAASPGQPAQAGRGQERGAPASRGAAAPPAGSSAAAQETQRQREQQQRAQQADEQQRQRAEQQQRAQQAEQQRREAQQKGRQADQQQRAQQADEQQRQRAEQQQRAQQAEQQRREDQQKGQQAAEQQRQQQRAQQADQQRQRAEQQQRAQQAEQQRAQQADQQQRQRAEQQQRAQQADQQQRQRAEQQQRAQQADQQQRQRAEQQQRAQQADQQRQRAQPKQDDNKGAPDKDKEKEKKDHEDPKG